MNDVSVQLRNIIASVLECKTSEVKEVSGLANHPGWDSLHHVMIIVEIEKVFNVEFKDEDIEKLIDFKLLLEYLVKYAS
jgi:acyl carrier protein